MSRLLQMKQKGNSISASMFLIDAHSHVWRSDWDAATRYLAADVLWRKMIEVIEAGWEMGKPAGQREPMIQREV